MRTFLLRSTSALILGYSIFVAVVLFMEPRRGNWGVTFYGSLKASFLTWLSSALRDVALSEPSTELEKTVADFQEAQFALNAKLVAFMRDRGGWEWNYITSKFTFDETGHLLDDWGNRVFFSLALPTNENPGSPNAKLSITGWSAGPNGVFEEGRNDDIVAVWENLLDGTGGRQKDRDEGGRKIGFWARSARWTSESHPVWAAVSLVIGISFAALCLLIDRRIRRKAGSAI